MAYQRGETTTDITIHMGRGEITGGCKTAEHEHSDGPYAVVQLSVPGTDITLFPGLENVDDLAAVFAKIAAELAQYAEEAKLRAVALED